MSLTGGGLGYDSYGACRGVVVIDRARCGELATGCEDIPLGGEDEVAEVGGGVDVTRTDICRDIWQAIERVHTAGRRRRRCAGAGGIDAGGNGGEIGRPAVEQAAVGALDVGGI